MPPPRRQHQPPPQQPPELAQPPGTSGKDGKPRPQSSRPPSRKPSRKVPSTYLELHPQPGFQVPQPRASLERGKAVADMDVQSR